MMAARALRHAAASRGAHVSGPCGTFLNITNGVSVVWYP